MRVNDILRYLQQRWRLKMIKKYKKQQEKLMSRDKKQLQRSVTHRRRSQDNSNKTGEQLREKYTSKGPEGRIGVWRSHSLQLEEGIKKQS